VSRLRPFQFRVLPYVERGIQPHTFWAPDAKTADSYASEWASKRGLKLERFEASSENTETTVASGRGEAA
jgi:hypothetical protein